MGLELRWDIFIRFYLFAMKYLYELLSAALPSSEGRAKRPGSSEKDDDAKSVSSVKSSTASTPNTAARRTPAQVKAESAARKAKVQTNILH